MASPQLSIKLNYQGEIHRLRIQLSKFTLQDLHRLFELTYELPEGYNLQYKDNEGEICTIGSDVEFQEACRVFLQLSEDKKTMSFFVTDKQANAALDKMAPVIKALEEFAEQVSAAVHDIATKAKESEIPRKAVDYATVTGQKCCTTVKETIPVVEAKASEASKAMQEGAMKLHEQAKEQLPVMQEKAKEASKAVQAQAAKLQEQAKEQMPVIQEKAMETGAMIQREAKEMGEYIRQESERLSETDFAQHVKDVAAQIQESVHDLVEEGRKYVDGETQYPGATPSEAEMQAAAISAAKAHVAAEEAAKEEAAKEEEEYMVVAPVDDREFAEEFKTIREMFPDAEYEKVAELLQKHEMNMQIVLNELMDL